MDNVSVSNGRLGSRVEPGLGATLALGSCDSTGPAGATEEDVERVLAGLTATAHTLRCWVREAGPLLGRLAGDYPPAAVLLESLAVAEAQPAHLGTPRHLEEATIEILRELWDLSAAVRSR